MITFETISKLELATLKEGDLVQVLGEFSEGDVALMTGKVYPALHNSSNRLVTIANGLKVEVFPTPLGDKDVTKKYVNQQDDKIKEQVNNLHTKREAIEWRSGLHVTDELQLYVHDGVEYLPDSEAVPFTIGSSFDADSWTLPQIITSNHLAQMYGLDTTIVAVGTVLRADNNAVTINGHIYPTAKMFAQSDAVIQSINLIATPYSMQTDQGVVYLRDISYYNNDRVSVDEFWTVVTGDNSAQFQAAILTAYTQKAHISVQDETWSPEVICATGRDYQILNKVYILSGVRLNVNGSRLTGENTSAGTTIFNPDGAVIIETGYFEGSSYTALSNINTAHRHIGTTIYNATMAFTNCAINAHNMNEQCDISNVRYSNCSKIMRLKSCFYLSLSRIISRNSAVGVGWSAVDLYDNDSNAMTFRNVNIVGSGVSVKISGTANFTLSFLDGCSFEEGKHLQSIGVYLEAGSYLSGLNISGSYFEGVSKGIVNDGGIYGLSVSTNIFNNTEYALVTGNGSSIRLGKWYGNSNPDGGGVNRNLIDVSAGINDIDFQTPDLSGTVGNVKSNPDTIIHSLLSKSDEDYCWLNQNLTDSIAISDNSPNCAKNNLIPLPYCGAGAKTVTNEVPFVTQTRSGDSLVLTTQITHDASNMLVCNFFGNCTNGDWRVRALILGDFIHILDGNCAISTSVVLGYLVLTIGRTEAVNPNFGANINISGAVRHM